MSKKPILGITMGDPSGIGPEISVKALGQAKVYEICRPLIIGDAGVIERTAREAVKRDIAIHPVSSVKECLFKPGTIDVYDLRNIEARNLKIGQVDAVSGEAAFGSVKKAIELALAGEIDATVTNPLNKEALNLAGHHYAGHTEIYADLTKTRDYAMLLADGDLRVAHVSTHVSLREACDRIKKDRVLKVIELAHNACVSFGISAPRVAVAGLNPHAGEGGLFGREEIEEITPAIEAAQSKGIDAIGPLPPDTVFAKALGGMYDIVIAMYHDQGHIPLKTLGFRYDKSAGKWQTISGVNITLGLPIVRSSVDHGTAFDQAWQGTANESSLLNAIEYGAKLSNITPMKTIYLAGGCFWGVEKYLSLIQGVVSTSAGYANGRTENPSYEEVCKNGTGHAETVKCEFDPAKISLGFLLELFYDAIDPTSLNRQGGDTGTQYRTGIYYTDEADRKVIQDSIALLQKKFDKPVVIEVKPLENFYSAEEYHQKYLDKNPAGYCHIGNAKFAKARLAVYTK